MSPPHPTPPRSWFSVLKTHIFPPDVYTTRLCVDFHDGFCSQMLSLPGILMTMACFLAESLHKIRFMRNSQGWFSFEIQAGSTPPSPTPAHLSELAVALALKKHELSIEGSWRNKSVTLSCVADESVKRCIFLN